jgi:hypothetical protein
MPELFDKNDLLIGSDRKDSNDASGIWASCVLPMVNLVK